MLATYDALTVEMTAFMRFLAAVIRDVALSNWRKTQKQSILNFHVNRNLFLLRFPEYELARGSVYIPNWEPRLKFGKISQKQIGILKRVVQSSVVTCRKFLAVCSQTVDNKENHFLLFDTVVAK